MPVKIVTDSTADLPPELIDELGISVVPIYIRVGAEVYRDGVDISHDELYRKLATGRVYPTTSQPLPRDFADVYRKLARETDEIVSIHVASNLSGTYQSARRAREMVDAACRIKVIDSRSVSMGLGLITITAARLAAAGGTLDTVLAEVREAIPNTRFFGFLDTLKYLFLGGRIGRAQALAGSVLKVKPIVTLRDGEFYPSGQARTRARGIERLFDFARRSLDIKELAVVHSTTPEEADNLSERIGASFLDRSRVHLARLGPALGVHGGPGTLAVALLGNGNAGRAPGV